MLDLSDNEQEALFDLLERTKLASIVRAGQTIADRSDFLARAARAAVYADEAKTVFREFDQRHTRCR